MRGSVPGQSRGQSGTDPFLLVTLHFDNASRGSQGHHKPGSGASNRASKWRRVGNLLVGSNGLDVDCLCESMVADRRWARLGLWLGSVVSDRRPRQFINDTDGLVVVAQVEVECIELSEH